MPTLEEVLIAEGLVTAPQVEEARRLDGDLRGGLGLNLVRLRHVTEQDIIDACRRVLPRIAVAGQSELSAASSFALGLLPLTLIERYRAVPVSLQGAELKVAMANPLDPEGIGAIERHTRCRVVPVLAAESVISWALLRYFNVLTPSFATGGGRAAATVSVAESEADAAQAIPLLRRRRGPVGDSPEDLSQVPVDLSPQRRKSQPPQAGDLGKLEAALERMERQSRRTLQAVPEASIVASPPPASAAPAAPAAPATPPPPATPEPSVATAATVEQPRPPVRVRPAVKTLPPPAPPAPAKVEIDLRLPHPPAAPVAAAPAHAPATTRPLVPLQPPRIPAVARPMATVQHPPTERRGPGSATRPLPLMPEPRAAPAKASVPVPPPPAAPPAAPAAAPPRTRVTTPRMALSAPFSPTTPGLPGLVPISDQSVQRLRDRIAGLDDRDAVTASALWTVEELIGPAAFIVRQENGSRIHRAGKHFRAIFGEAERVLRPGEEPRIERAFADGRAQVSAAEPFPWHAVGRRSVPPNLVLLPVAILGKVAGVIVVFGEKALEVMRGETERYEVISTAVSDRLLAIMRKKKGK